VSFRVFDTHLGAQGMEYICELWHYLVPFLLQRGPFCILVIVASNMVILFLNSILERTPSGYDCKQCGFLCGLFLTVSVPPILDMGENLKERKGDLSLSKKLWIEKYPLSKFNHLSRASASI
jgi:hypothetical protein